LTRRERFTTLSCEELSGAESFATTWIGILSSPGLASGNLDEGAVIEQMLHLHELAGFERMMPPRSLKRLHQWFLDLSRKTFPPKDWTPLLEKNLSCGLEAGDRVWAHLAGPRYVRKVEGNSLYLNRPGACSQNEKENFYTVNAGYVIRIPHIVPPSD